MGVWAKLFISLALPAAAFFLLFYGVGQFGPSHNLV